MAYSFTVQDNKVLFSNDEVKNIVLFEFEFVTDAPKVCRLLRKAVKQVRDVNRLIDTSDVSQIKSYQDDMGEQVSFRVRFNNPFDLYNDIVIHTTVREW
jgi:N-glycosylase/DNA lyase